MCMMVLQFLFVFVACAIFREINRWMYVKNCQRYCEKQIVNNFPWSVLVLLSTIQLMSGKIFKSTNREKLSTWKRNYQLKIADV